jgi:23S rRNA pseudouridine2605 synthase
MVETEKLQKVLARAGLGSRREIETWIADRRVSVNGKIATLGDRVTEQDKIRVDGRQITIRTDRETRTEVLMYNKPEGEICSQNDPESRTTVFATLPRLNQGRWIMIGRLDINTSGLLLFTNNGELAHRLMHPSYEIEREYAIRVFGEVDRDMLNRLKEGVMLDDGMAKFDWIRDAGGTGANHWYHVSLHEGRNREVRRLWEAENVVVSRLIRVRYGNVMLPRSIRRGKWDYLDTHGINELKKLVEL